MARVQFRLPNGSSQTQSFSAGAPLSSVYQFVTDEVNTGLGRNFSLSTTFPRRQLDDEPRTASLREVGLAPSGTVMILPTSQVSMQTGSLMDFVWLLLTPFTFIWTFIQSFISTNVPNNAATSTNERKRPGDGAGRHQQS